MNKTYRHEAIDGSVFVWSAVLTDIEIAALAKGFSPLLVKSNKLVYASIMPPLPAEGDYKKFDKFCMEAD